VSSCDLGGGDSGVLKEFLWWPSSVSQWFVLPVTLGIWARCHKVGDLCYRVSASINGRDSAGRGQLWGSVPRHECCPAVPASQPARPGKVAACECAEAGKTCDVANLCSWALSGPARGTWIGGCIHRLGTPRGGGKNQRLHTGVDEVGLKINANEEGKGKRKGNYSGPSPP